MEKQKSKKSSVESKQEEIKESKQEPSRKIIKPVITFDSYFAKVLKENPSIQPHHKAPMRAYAQQHDLMSGTLEDFQRVFRRY